RDGNLPSKGMPAAHLRYALEGACRMNKHIAADDLVSPKVTTGPISGSRKTYTTPATAPDLRVPLREVPLTEAAGEPPVPLYDTSGPYTDPNAVIDVEHGISRARIEWVRERGGVSSYQGREVKSEDNGNVAGKHLARSFPSVHAPLQGEAGKPITQLEWARAGVVT